MSAHRRSPRRSSQTKALDASYELSGHRRPRHIHPPDPRCELPPHRAPRRTSLPASSLTVLSTLHLSGLHHRRPGRQDAEAARRGNRQPDLLPARMNVVAASLKRMRQRRKFPPPGNSRAAWPRPQRHHESFPGSRHRKNYTGRAAPTRLPHRAARQAARELRTKVP